MIAPAMRSAPLALTIALACGARSELPCPDCASPTADPGEAPRCQGTGQIWTSLEDDCIDDGGSSGAGDVLEVYCVDDVARFCLSHEDCPWRDGTIVAPDVTCSTAGLESTYMANTINGCAGFEQRDLYCCSPEGHIRFSGC